jgi:hypothetical protein
MAQGNKATMLGENEKTKKDRSRGRLHAYINWTNKDQPGFTQPDTYAPTNPITETQDYVPF